MIQISRLTQSESTGAIVFYFSAVTAIISVGPMLAAQIPLGSGPLADAIASQRFIVPGSLDFVSLSAIGLFGGCAQILLTQCYRHADASVIAGFDYASMIWAAALGYLVFAEIPAGRVLIGAAIVMAAGAAMLIWERQARPTRRRPNVAPIDMTTRNVR
jgi:drug/metabolite transporter (DMT)-like permease